MGKSSAALNLIQKFLPLSKEFVRGRAKFEEQMALARDILETNPAALPSLIRLIGRRVQAEELCSVIDHPPHKRGPDADFKTLFFHESTHLSDDGLTFYKLVKQQDGPYYRLNLGRDLILPWPWHKQRIVDSLSFIGFGKRCGPWRAARNHRVQIVLPIGVGLVYGGNHSLAAGIVNGEGEVINTHSIDITPLYSYIRYDGTAFRRIGNGQIIKECPNSDMGAIFEIGRLMAENGISFDGELVNKSDFEHQTTDRTIEYGIKYHVYRNGEIQPYDASKSAVVNILTESGIIQGSNCWQGVLFENAPVYQTRHGTSTEWRFELFYEKPTYNRIIG